MQNSSVVATPQSLQVFKISPAGQGYLFTLAATTVTLPSLRQGKLPPAIVIDLVAFTNAVAGRFGLSREPLALLRSFLAA